MTKAYIDKFFKGLKLSTSGNVVIETSKIIEFKVAAVDGGVLNNEPFMEAFNYILHPLKHKDYPYAKKTYRAIIMIDPFPNFETVTDEEYQYPKGLFDLIKGLIASMRGQAMLKDIHALEKISLKHSFLFGMISPTRKNEQGCREEPALATSALGGFGGFLSEEFRVHDFYLGMKNAQSFLQKYFNFPDEIDKKSLQIIPDRIQLPVLKPSLAIQLEESLLDRIAAKEKYVSPDEKKEGQETLLPDLEVFEKKTDLIKQQKQVPLNLSKFKGITFPVFPVASLEKLQGLIFKRINFILYRLTRRIVSEKALILWGSPLLKRQQLIWIGGMVVVALGLLVAPVFFIGAQVYWGLILCWLIFVMVVRYAVIRWITIYCIRIMGNELKKNKQLL